MSVGVGTELTAQAALVTDALEAGDVTTARSLAEALLADVEAKIAAGEIPGALQAPLRAGVTQLLATLPEPTPPPPEKKPKKHEEKKKKPHEKDDKKGKH
jgi:hypothetical protein